MKVLLVGASGGVAQAIAKELIARGHSIFAVSRKPLTLPVDQYLCADLSTSKGGVALEHWLTTFPSEVLPDVVIQCAGILHDENTMPEKNLKQICTDWINTSMQVNLYSHIYTAQAVSDLVKRSRPIRWVSLSALVGSISDNELGGWYSYRMSKAALNMFIRNLDIEWRRKSPDSIVVALHPGTTKTNLSEPFQANIGKDKLYEPELTGRRLVEVIEGLRPEQSGQLLHWDGSIVSY